MCGLYRATGLDSVAQSLLRGGEAGRSTLEMTEGTFLFGPEVDCADGCNRERLTANFAGLRANFSVQSDDFGSQISKQLQTWDWQRLRTEQANTLNSACFKKFIILVITLVKFTFWVRARFMFWEDSLQCKDPALARPGCCLAHTGVRWSLAWGRLHNNSGNLAFKLSYLCESSGVGFFGGGRGNLFLRVDSQHFENLTCFIQYVKMRSGPFLLAANEWWNEEASEVNRAKGLGEVTGEVWRWNRNKGQQRSNNWLWWSQAIIGYWSFISSAGDIFTVSACWNSVSGGVGTYWKRVRRDRGGRSAFRSRSSEERDEKTSIWLKTRSDEGRP